MIALLLIACVAGPPVPERIDALTVVALATDPPEPAFGEQVTVTAAVADPERLGCDLLLWTCVHLPDGGCAETEHGVPLQDRARIIERPGPLAQVAFAVPEAPSELEDDVRVSVWALACVPGACEVLEALRVPPTEPADVARVSAWLDAVLSWPDTPPFGAAHLAFRTTTLFVEVPEVRNHAPEIDVRTAGGRHHLQVFDPDDEAWRLRAEVTTGSIRTERSETGATLRWEDAGDGHLYVVVDDQRDGVAIRVVRP